MRSMILFRYFYLLATGLVLCLGFGAQPANAASSPIFSSGNGAGQVQALARDGQNVFVAATDSSRALRLYTSTDDGASFNSGTVISSGAVVNGTELTMCADGQGSLYLFWENNSDSKLYYAMASATNGAVTKSSTPLTASFQWADSPSCAVDSGSVYVLFRAFSNPKSELNYFKLTNGSVTAGPVQVTNNSIQEDAGKIAVNNGQVYVAYADMYSSYNIFLVRSGNGFSTPVRVNKVDGKGTNQIGHAITVDAARGKVIVAYSDSATDYEGDMVVAVSDLQASSFSYTYPSSSTYRYQMMPRIELSGSKLYLAWTDFRNNRYDVYGAVSDDGGLNFQPDKNLTNTPAGGENMLKGFSINGSDAYFSTSDATGFPTVKGQFYKVSLASAPTLSSLMLSCPNTINASASNSCSATANYSDASSKSVSASWSSSNPTVLSVNSGGSLTAETPSSDTSVTITANYSEGGVSKTATAMVMVKATMAQLSGLTVNCPSSVNAGATATCTATASYANGTSNTVNATWTSSDLSVATVNGNNAVANSNISTDTPVSLNASYSENGVTKTATAIVTVKAVATTTPPSTGKLTTATFDNLYIQDVVDTSGTTGTMGTIYVLATSRKSPESYFTDPDGTKSYKSDLYLLKIDSTGNVTKLKLGDVAPNGAQPGSDGGALLVSGQTLYAFRNSKSQNATYAMDGYLYTIDASSLSLTKTTTLFTNANWGWFPVIKSGPTVSHFSFAGYYRYLDTTNQGSVIPDTMATESRQDHAAHSGGLMTADETSDINGANRTTIINRIVAKVAKATQGTTTPPITPPPVSTTCSGTSAFFNPANNLVCLPTVSIPSVFGGSSYYQVELNLIMDSDPLKLALKTAVQISASGNASASYNPATNSVNIPALQVPGVFGGMQNYQVELTAVPTTGGGLYFTLKSARPSGSASTALAPTVPPSSTTDGKK